MLGKERDCSQCMVIALHFCRRHFPLTVPLSAHTRGNADTPLTSHFPLRSIPIMIPMRQANLCSSHVLLNSLRYTLHTGSYSSGQESGHTHVVERSSLTTHMRPLVQKTFRQGSVERMRQNEFLRREINDGHRACEQAF